MDEANFYRALWLIPALLRDEHDHGRDDFEYDDLVSVLMLAKAIEEVCLEELEMRGHLDPEPEEKDEGPHGGSLH